MMIKLGDSRKFIVLLVATLLAIGLFAMPALALEQQPDENNTQLVETTIEDEPDPADDGQVEPNAADTAGMAGAAGATPVFGEADPPPAAPPIRAFSNLGAIAELTGPDMKVDDVPHDPTQAITVNRDTVIYLGYTWKLLANTDTNSIQAGDYTVLGSLPAGLPFAGDLANLTIEVKDTNSGKVIGHITFEDTGGTGVGHSIVLTFAEGVIGLQNVTGSFYIESQIDFSQTSVPGDTADLVMTGDGSFSFSDPSIPAVGLEKRFVKATLGGSTEAQQYSFDTLEWEIDINTEEETIQSAVVTDTVSMRFSSGASALVGLHIFKNLRVDVYELTVTHTEGGVKLEQAANPINPGLYTVSRDSGKPDTVIHIDLGEISKAYRIVVKTDVDLAKTYSVEYATILYRNTATFNGVEDMAEFSTYIGAQNNKYGVFKNDREYDYILWDLYINRYALDYGNAGKNIVVTDTLPAGLEVMEIGNVLEFSIYKRSFNIATGEQQDTLVYETGNSSCNDYTPYLTGPPSVAKDAGTGITTIQFGLQSINGTGYHIVLPTKITDGEAYQRGGFKNTFEYEIDNLGNIIRSYTVAPHDSYSKATLTKVGIPSAMTHNTMDWEVTYTVKEGSHADGLELVDHFYSWEDIDQTLRRESLVITLNGTQLEEGPDKDYILKNSAQGEYETPISGSYTGSFYVKFNNTITGTLVLTFQSDYTLAYIDESGSTVKKGGIARNTAIATAYIDDDTEPTIRERSATQTVADEFTLNGSKKGVYKLAEGTEGDTITWTVDINPHGSDLGSEVGYADIFGPNQAYVGGLADLKVYLVENGMRTRELERGGGYNDKEYFVEESPVGSTTGFTIIFNNMGTSHYQIEYKTGVLDESIPLAEYTNKGIITMYRDEANHPKYEIGASARRPGDKNVLQKGMAKVENYDLMSVSITLNGDGKHHLKNATLTDRMSRGLVFVEDSLKIVDTNFNYELVPGKDYTFNFTTPDNVTYTEFTIEFTGNPYASFSNTLKVTYQARLDASNAQKDEHNPGHYVVSNEAVLRATDVLSWSTDDHSTFITTGGGSGSGEDNLASFRVFKQGSNGEGGLGGAEFKLYKQDGTLYTDAVITTAATGYSPYYTVEPGQYYLLEVKAPDGYEHDATAKISVALPDNSYKEITIVVNNTKLPYQPAPPTKTILTVNGQPATEDTIVKAGDLVTYKITYDMPPEAAGVRVVDLLPRGTSVVGANPATGGSNDSRYTWVIDAADATGEVEITLRVDTVPENATHLVNRAQVYYLYGSDEEKDPEEPTVKNPYPDPEPEPEPEPTTPGPGSSSNPGSSSMPGSSSRPGSSTQPSSSTVVGSSSSEVPSPGPDPTPSTSSSTTTSRPRASSTSRASTSNGSTTNVPPAGISTSNGTNSGGTSSTGGRGSSSIPVIEGAIQPDGTRPTRDFLAGVPLGNFGEGSAWSLLNLIMSLLSLFSAIVLFAGLLRRKKQNEAQQANEGDDDEETPQPAPRRRRLTALRLPAIFMGLAPGILFLVLENIRLPMTWITKWTPIIGLAFIVHMALVLVHFVITKRSKHNDDEWDGPEGQPA